MMGSSEEVGPVGLRKEEGAAEPEFEVLHTTGEKAKESAAEVDFRLSQVPNALAACKEAASDSALKRGYTAGYTVESRAKSRCS